MLRFKHCISCRSVNVLCLVSDSSCWFVGCVLAALWLDFLVGWLYLFICLLLVLLVCFVMVR